MITVAPVREMKARAETEHLAGARAIATLVMAAMLHGLAFGQASSGGASENPDARSLVRKIVEYLGGEATLRRISSIKTMYNRHAKTPYGDAMIEIEQIAAYPDRLFMGVRSSQGATTTVLKPDGSFMVTAGAVRELPVTVSNEAAKSMKLGLVFVAQHVNDPDYKFSLKGSEPIGDIATTVLEITVKEDKTVWNVEPLTGRVLRATRTVRGFNGAASSAIFDYSDWRKVDGVTLPFRTAEDGPVSAVDDVRSVEINPQISASLFEKPSAMRSEVIPSRAQKNEVPFANQRYTVVSRGLAVAICDTFDSNMFAVNPPTLPIHIENNVAKHSVSDLFGANGFFGKCNGVVAEPLIVGEIVTATASTIHGREFRLRIVSAPHSIRRGIGAYEHTTHEPGAAELRFKLSDPKDLKLVEAAISAWLRPTSELPGNTASGVQVPQIREGMTAAEVEAALGAPDLKFDSEGATTYTYKTVGVVVVFRDGKVAKIVTPH
jgi:hypothetical protein